MDIQKIIASGILEQFVLGDLSPEERRKVEQYAMEYPEIKEEIEAIEDALEQYALANAITPSPGLESKILDKIEEKKAAADHATPSDNNARVFQIISAIAVAASVAALIWIVFLNNKLSEQANDLANLQSQYEELNSDCTEQQKEQERNRQMIAFLTDPNTSEVRMEGIPEKAPGAVALVFQNTALEKTYLEVVDLPDIPTDKQFQLWAIVDGTPVDMGVFDVPVTADTSLLEVPFVSNAATFAVTIENAGGSPTPTLEEMVVAGNVTG